MTEESAAAPVEMKPVFPVTIRMQGFPVARLHADGRCEGRVDALQAILQNYKQPNGNPDMNGMLLWIVLHALLNQRILGTADQIAAEVK